MTWLVATLLVAAPGLASAWVTGPPFKGSTAVPGPPLEGSIGSDPAIPARPVVRASRLESPVTVDGALTEPIWRSGEAFEELVQRDPVEGGLPSQRTAVRVAYDDDAIYLGARLYDNAPDSIIARLARRDASIASDRFAVYLDPYHDRRSGYYFMVNAAGTLYDGTLSNDVDDDKSWDGVWEGKARVDEQGWTVEMRIAYSQLRFQRGGYTAWGINFGREIPRRREKDFVVYRPRKESGFVSRFPDLVGVEHIEPGRSIELMPYATSQGEYLKHEAGDPFNDGSRLRLNGGGDLRAGIGSGMTLNATVNPDFGQVEVDPASVNLTDFESFFEEKRPFFVEGASTFEFGRQGAGDYWDYDWEDPLFFYSRRIGREPQGKVPSADFADAPVATRILGAAKLIGRVGPTWSLGTLHAVTKRETAVLQKDGTTWDAEIEPLTYYGVARAQREFAGRRLGLGFLGTAALRSSDDPVLPNQLNSDSWLGGFDGWAFLDRNETWVLSGWSAVSTVRGTTSRMVALQRSSAHYFQRPDADYLGVNPTATSLAGFGSRYWINKQKGAVQFNAGAGMLSPGFDVNDLGYQKRSDLLNAHVGTGYKWTRATRLWRYQSLKAALFGTYDYGGNPTKRGLQASGYTELHNGSTGSYYVAYNPQTINNRRTRGGPLTLNPKAFSFGADFETDSQRRWYTFAELSGSRSASGSWAFDLYPGVEWKPAPTFNLKIGPCWERLHEDAQYVTSLGDPTAAETYGRRYVFAALDQNSAWASLRLNWTFTPQLSLQTYVQPFISSAGYRDFKALVRAGSYEFTPTTDTGNQDFTVRSLKGNAVLRWEYRPGSALFLVWTQKRSDYQTVDEFTLSADRLLETRPENVFLAKLSCYFTP
ncbi:MAG TPA: DUF5916 domain-containing protein [Candidatus Eisenbacteria bacterium]